MKKIHILNAINTDAGKTFISCKMINQRISDSKKINYLKPIISGFEEKNLIESDIGMALNSLKLQVSMENAKKITKYFLKAPISPNIAARLENIKIEYEKILEFCKEKIQNSLMQNEEILIEMAGGVCTPITNLKTMLDLTQDISSSFEVNNILVVSNYLGCISHTLSACKLFKFDEIIWNAKDQKPYDNEVVKTLKGLLKLKEL